MNEEEALRYAVRKTLEQGKQSLNENGKCSYRGQGGICCAVGFLIDDKYYDTKLEGCSVADGEVVDSLDLSGIEITSKVIDTLMELQDCHDNCMTTGFTEDFKSRVEHKIKQGHLPEYLLEELQ